MIKRHALLIATFAAVAIIAVLFLVNRREEQAQLNAESSRFADQAVLAVASNWDKEALLERGSEELLQSAQFQIDIDAQFLRWRILGPMVRYHGVKGKATLLFSLQTGKIITAVYSASAEFERGAASIAIGLVKREKWQVASFQVLRTVYFHAPTVQPHA